ncbi:MAG: pentapeptide repeat-containing protein [Saprospiraceae bacterium]|nr:pentapeptide repeat-containing protein [Saprospiraceae bacterium]
MIGAVIRRLLWSGIALALIAILPALFSFYILLRQNDLIDAQNKIQNRQLRVQELSIESQKNIDYERQMDKIFLNLPDSIKLEQVNQIVSFSKFIQPSRFDLNTNLDLKNPISKIKANLLLKIVEDKRLENIISDILIKADFSNSDLRYQFIEDKNFNYIKANNSDFSETILKNVNIKGSNLKGTFFQSCRLELCHFNGSKIADADLKNCTFSQCFLRNVDFSGTDLRDTKFFNCIFINEADIVSNKFNLNMAKVSSTKFFANIWNEHNIGVDQIERFFISIHQDTRIVVVIII